MAVENVRLTVRDWDGTLRHERYFEHANPALWVNVPANGVECSRDGYGNCLEATWAAYADTLGTEPRDVIEIDSLVNGVWGRDFAGVLLKSGNTQAIDARSNFKLVGLKKRLQEVRVVTDAVEGDVAAQARTALQQVIASGQLGNAILFDAALMPDAGVILSGFRARGRRLGSGNLTSAEPKKLSRSLENQATCCITSRQRRSVSVWLRRLRSAETVVRVWR